MSETIRRDAAIETAKRMYAVCDTNSHDDYAMLMEEALKVLPSAQPENIRCKDCKYWVPGYITDNDDFIPPKCGEWQQMVGHSSDDYCSRAERREDE